MKKYVKELYGYKFSKEIISDLICSCSSITKISPYHKDLFAIHTTTQSYKVLIQEGDFVEINKNGDEFEVHFKEESKIVSIDEIRDIIIQLELNR